MEIQVNTSLEKRTCLHRLATGDKPDLQVDASSTQAAKKPLCSLARAPVLRKTTLKPTCVGLPNGEKLAFTCVQILISIEVTQDIASHHKHMQATAKRSSKLSQDQLATTFGQGVKCFDNF